MAPGCAATAKLTCEMTLRDGKIVYELNGLSRPDWTTLPKGYRSTGDPRWDGNRSSNGGLTRMLLERRQRKTTREKTEPIIDHGTPRTLDVARHWPDGWPGPRYRAEPSTRLLRL